jgi:hypothetical protein
MEIPICGISIKIENNKIKEVKNGNGFIHPTRKKQYIQLIENTLNKYKIEDKIILINLSDHPILNTFGFCKEINKNNYYLLPNHRFTNDDVILDEKKTKFKNFDDEKEFIFNNDINFKDKTNKIFTSCIPHKNKMDYILYSLENTFCESYVYIGSVHGTCGISNNIIEKLSKQNKCGKEYQPWLEHTKYKYIIYNDGNTLSDRFRLLLCLNAIIIKKKSKYEEFYSYKLQDKINYIEYNNVNELKEIFEYLEKNQNICEDIISNNKKFLKEYLNYDNILHYTYLALSK